MQTALVACPYSGRGCARSSARPSTWASAASGGYHGGAASNRRHRSCASRRRAASIASPARSNAGRLLTGIEIVVEERDLAAAVLCCAPTNQVAASMRRPALAKLCADARVVGHLGERAGVRPAAPPPHAPQSWADSCGLFRLIDPWPTTSTSGDRRSRIPVSSSTRRTMSAHLPTVNPECFPSAAPRRSRSSSQAGLPDAERCLLHAAPPRREPREHDAQDQRDERQHPNAVISTAPRNGDRLATCTL